MTTSLLFVTIQTSERQDRYENSNGLLREFFPKKTNFDHVTEDAMNISNYNICFL